MTFSAMSFDDAASTVGSSWAAMVPLMGAETTRSPRRDRNVSGEKLATEPQSPCRKADLAGRVRAARSAKNADAEPVSVPEKRVHRHAW